MPKGFVKNIKLTKSKVGPARRQEILDGIDNQGTYLPRGVCYEDMDKAFIDSINKDFYISIDGKKVPVIFLTIQRWSEFSKTWQHSDEFKDVKLPFITIVRKPDVQVGTNQAGNWNIPGQRGYTYIKVPTNDGLRVGVDVYKIPQPTSVDVTYEVRLFCNKMRDLNKLHKVIQQTFNSRQHYVKPNGHPMPVHLETIGDESNIDDFENRRFYVQLFEMKLLGYLLDEDEFEVIPTVNRMKLTERIEGSSNRGSSRSNGEVTYTLNFLKDSVDTYTITTEYSTTFTSVSNEINTNTIDILVGGNPVTFPFTLEGGKSIEFAITRTDTNLDSSFVLNGLKN